MPMLSRRATSGTHLKLRVPEWRACRVKRAKNSLIWHTFTKKHEKARVPKWHTVSFADVFFRKSLHSGKSMINYQFQCCNPRCEVCGKSNHIQINRDNQTDIQNDTNTNREINFFKTGNLILPENLDSY